MSKLSAYVEPGFASLLDEAKERHHAATEAETDQRELEVSDLRFCDPVQQWDEDVRSQRSADGRPCLSVDRLSTFVHQVVNETRQQRPQPQVNPIGDGADKDTAEILQGMIRHITYMSNGDTAIDRAYESMVRCGRGFFRVLTEYTDPESFDQEIVIKSVPSLHMVAVDPSFTEPDGSDMEWAFIGSYIPSNVYRQEYPKSKMASLDDGVWASIGDEAPDWVQKDGAGCLVVEYFRKIRKATTICRLKSGKVVKKADLKEGQEVEDERESIAVEVQWFKLNALEVLDETVWPGKYIPIIPVLGTELIIEGKRTWSGLIRNAKDAQRAYNYWKSAQAETIALAPRSPWVGPKGFMGNMRNLWQTANKKPVAALEYEVIDQDGKPLPAPSRTFAEPPISAITQAMVGAVDDLKASTGMFDASLGNREANQSGIAIRSLQQQGQTGNFHLQDNLSRSVRFLGRILIDLVPNIYSEKRTTRIIRPDDTADVVTVNGPSGVRDKKTGMEKVYDITTGTYDVAVSVGPSYQTKRQENLAFLESLMKGPMGQLLTAKAPDLVVAMTDFAVTPQLTQRLKDSLPPGTIQDEGSEGDAPQIPPQAKQMMDQMSQQNGALTQQLHAALDQLESAKEKADQEMAQKILDAETRIKVAEITANAQIAIAEMKVNPVKGEAEGDAQLADAAVHAQKLEELEQLVLSMHEALTAPGAPAAQGSAPNPAPPEPPAPAPNPQPAPGPTGA